MKGFKNTWVEGVHYDVIPQSEISKINKKISEDSTLNVNYKPERMYSEEEVKEILEKRDKHNLGNLTLGSRWLTVEDWFEHFKKK